VTSCSTSRSAPGVAEADALQPQPAGDGRHRPHARAVEHRGRGVEHLVHPLGRGLRLLRLRGQPAERVDRPLQHEEQRHERDQPAEAELALGHRDAAAQRHQREHDLREDLQDDPEVGQHGDLLQLGTAQLAGLVQEPAQRQRPPAERADRADAGSGLLDVGGQLTVEVLRPPGHPRVAQLEPADGDHQRHGERQHQQGQRPVLEEQQDPDDHADRGVDDQEDQPEAEEPADRGQVLGRPGQQLAGRPAVVEGDRQRLQVPVEVTAQVGLHSERGLAHHPAADQHRHRLEDAEQQGEPGQRVQRAAVTGADGVVDDPRGDQRYGRGGELRGERRPGHGEESGPIGARVPPDAPERGVRRPALGHDDRR
jgi:hypothetical protein